MSDFSLSRRVEKVLPRAVVIDGAIVSIDADFRNVLRIVRLLKDDCVLERHKREMICRFFYVGFGRLDCCPFTIEQGVRGFFDFITANVCNDEFSRDSDFPNDMLAQAEQTYDFEIDAREIYVSFLAEYGIDLLDVSYIHFCKFLILLVNLSEASAFKRKVALRFMDLSGMKGKEFSKMLAAKEAVQLPERVSVSEMQEQIEFERIWGIRD